MSDERGWFGGSWVGVALLALLWAPGDGWAQDEPEPAAESEESTAPRGGGRMEFDERLVKGEKAAGSVYLFKRRPRTLPGLVPMRRSYRTRIVEPVLGNRELKPVSTRSAAEAADESEE